MPLIKPQSQQQITPTPHQAAPNQTLSHAANAIFQQPLLRSSTAVSRAVTQGFSDPPPTAISEGEALRDDPAKETRIINLLSKETQNLFSDYFGFKNPVLYFLKETHHKLMS